MAAGTFPDAATAPFPRRTPCLAPFPSRFASSFFDLWTAGRSAADAADHCGLNRRTVQRLFARFAAGGQDAVVPDYDACGQDQPHRLPDDVIDRLCRAREEHAGWGSELIRLELARPAAGPEAAQDVPAARTIRRHLRRAGLQRQADRPPSTDGPRPRLSRATRPHESWQVDASEELALRTGRRVCWLRVVDECSGAFLHTEVFPEPRWEHVDRHVIQDRLRDVFRRWGLPGRFRVDNGYPWGSTGDFPPEMALWLLGLGVDLAWIAPGCPRQNGVIERAQQTGQDWFEPQTCASVAELQRRSVDLDRLQRERYPYRDGRSRWQVYPDLRHSGRSYRRRGEPGQWEPERVWQALSERVGRRRVDKTGSVSVYNRGRSVGKEYVGTDVWVRLDPSGPTWVIRDGDGRLLRTHAAAELSASRIRALDVLCRKARDRP